MQLIPQTLKPLAAFAHLSGRTVTTTPSRSLRRRMRTPAPLTVSQWADQHRRVTEIDAKPGRWRNEMVPHAVPIMDSISKPWVRQVWICLPERGAKTQILLNTVCWGIDQGAQAGNIFWLMPTEADARKALGERIIPAFRAKDDHGRPGRIARYLSHAADDTSRGSIRFNHGIRLFPAWANSPGSMASYFGRINIADECDKFPERTSEGTDPITLFLKRARDDRHRSKYVFASTPAGKFIHKGAMACQQINTWALRCPDCGDYVLPTAEHLVIPETVGARRAVPAFDHEPVGARRAVPDCDLDQERARHAVPLQDQPAIACPACGTLWDEEARAVAYHGGRAQTIKGAEITRPESVGWHIPAYFFPIIPLTEIAAAYLRMKTGDHAAKVAWANGYEVIDYENATAARKEDSILALRDERREGELPAQPFACISAVADMQKRGFWYKITAWGYGLEQESWLLKAGFIDSWEALRRLFYESEFIDATGQAHIISLRGIDSGGGEGEGELSKTAEAYLFAYRNPSMHLFKGQQSMSSLFRGVPQDKIPGTNKALPNGLTRHNLNTTELKNRLAAKLQVAPGDPGAWHLHRDVDQDFARQMCAEVLDENGHWQNPKNAPNHLWDCSAMELALVEIAQVKLWPHPDSIAAAPQRRVISKGVKRRD